MERENYFILLGLSFDPAETDRLKIEKNIKKKQADWEFAKNNIPAKRDEASRYLAMVEDIRKVMLSPELRNAEAQNALEIKMQKAGELKKASKKLLLAGTPSESSMKKIWRDYAKYGFSLQEIKEMLADDDKEEKYDIETISRTDADKIQDLLAKLGLKGKNLYDFLGISASSSPGSAVSEAKKIAKETQLKAEDPARDGIIGQLCNICVRLFANKTEKKKYDVYLDLMKYPELNEAVDHAAKESGTISPKAKLRMIEYGSEQYHAGVQELSLHISNYCQYKGYEVAEDKVICGLCNAENAAGASICEKCRKPLFLICPSCDTKNSNAAQQCIKCGFTFANIQKVEQILKSVRQLLADNRYEDADKALSQAKQLWGGHPDLADLNSQIEKLRGNYIKLSKQIDEDLAKKNYYSARIHINEAKNCGYTVRKEIVDKVNHTIEEVEHKAAKCNHMPDDEAFHILSQLMDIIADSAAIQQQLRHYPPKAPQHFKAALSGKSVNLSWDASASAGNIVYIVMRKGNGYSSTISDGEKIYEGSSLFCSDPTIKSKTAYDYTLFAVRAGIPSSGCRLKKEIVFVENVKNVRLVSGDASLQLSWDYDEDVEKIDIGICQSKTKPQALDSFHLLENMRKDGVRIPDLANGRTYWVMVRACYQILGAFYASPALIEKGIPSRPARPMDGFGAHHMENNRYNAGWETAEWDVILFVSDKEPPFQEGMMYDLGDIASKCRKVPYVNLAERKIEFSLDFVGRCYLIPAQVRASNVVVNRPVILTNIPMAENVTMDFNRARTEMYVNFKWPKKMRYVLFAYRHDQFPDGPEDELAKKIFCSREQYDNNAGILIANPMHGMYYGMVYSYISNGDRKIYAEGAKAVLDYEPQRLVYFSFSYKKPLFAKKAVFSVSIRSEGSFLFPKFLIVGKNGGRPLKKTDGFVVCKCEEEVSVNGNHTYCFDTDAIGKGTVMQMFFMDDANYTRFKIQNEGNRSI